MTVEPLQEFHFEPLSKTIIGPSIIVSPEPRESIPLDPPTVDPSMSRPLQTYHRHQPPSTVPVHTLDNVLRTLQILLRCHLPN